MLDLPMMICMVGDKPAKLYTMTDDDGRTFIPIFKDGELADKFKKWVHDTYSYDIEYVAVEDNPQAKSVFQNVCLTIPDGYIAVNPVPGEQWLCESLMETIERLMEE